MPSNAPINAARLSAFLITTAILPTLTAAQSYSSCNPTNTSQFPCPADTGLCQSTVFETDFTTGDNTSWTTTAGNVTYSDAGAAFTIAERGDAPTIETDFYIFYGRVEVTMKAAPGTGIVSSIVIESDDLDEIDWEFLGGSNTMVQSNYFGKGNTTSYDREAEHAVTTPQDTSHVYAIDWTASRIEWLIDNTTVRTLAYADAVSGQNFPQTPATVRLGIWAGGDEDNSYWTRVWAGGNTTYSAAAGMPWTMTVEKVAVTNYGPAGSYNYTDSTGDAGSVALIGTDCGGSDGGSSSSSSSSSSGSSSKRTASVSAYAASTPSGTGATATPTPTPSGGTYETSGGVERLGGGLREFLFGSVFVALLLL
ncbi:glycosidase crf1 [Diplodia corticola]|uniref:chitinase n=1 Tax=Diplodia corticola TaxID=236234 RepID=A0A1J9S9N8_9PEZI|nr:glycosidase crf1 [Diplodia corticola]OJD36612.1 glycosidase crf1 [Diplodia corticola]